MLIRPRSSENRAPTAILNWLEDEIFFSLGSRQHLIWGNVGAATTTQMLFRSACGTITHDFPHNLDDLRCDLRSVWGNPETIIHRHTILPMFFPFQSLERVQAAMQALKGNRLGSIKYRLGLVSGRFGGEHPLKACSACMDADTDAYGCAYWHLSHQYPGVIICPTHRLRLQESILNRQWSGRFQWALPDASTLTPRQREAFAPSTQRALFQFATSILDLAGVGTSKHFDPTVVASVYRIALREMGFLQPVSEVSASSLVEFATLLQPYHPLTSLPTTAKQASTFIEQLIRNPRRHSHPLKHLVMITWLFERISTFIEAYDRQEARQMQGSSAQAQKPYRNTPHTGRAESSKPVARKLKPKILKSPIRSEILRLLKQGISKKYICSKFKITVSTVNKLLRAEPIVKDAWKKESNKKFLIGQRSDWILLIRRNHNSSAQIIRSKNPKLYAWLYRNDRAWLLQKSKQLPTGRIGNHSNIDWSQRDEHLESLIMTSIHKNCDAPVDFKLPNVDICTLQPELSRCLQNRNQYPRTRRLLLQIKRHR